MAEFITIQSNNPDIFYTTKTDTYGGVQFNVGINPDVAETLRWVKEYRIQLAKEAKAREENSSVKAAYDQYQTVLNLVLD